ncbi:hypothetical protein BDN71DRAFT_1459090 [Pleurotus eryngii]|uniref:Uncharacterized protein n=1 Tax=Pleurotus eryngii TaxID=5323 RepID=A0A9P5ZG70_PLEER|nr:hypothetical protein BDN71DRAFT_1459090 [Pleurotus eryngii]
MVEPGQDKKRTKWAADFTHFRAGNKANASKIECEPSEGDHEERTSGLAQSEFMAVGYLYRWNLESTTAIVNRYSFYPDVPFPNCNSNLTEHAKEEVSTQGMNQLFKVQGHTTFCGYLSAPR